MNLNSSEIRLLLTLFINQNHAFSPNPFGENKLDKWKIEDKIFHEIENSISDLALGKSLIPNLNNPLISSSEGTGLPVYYYRTICMLLGLRKFFKDVELGFLNSLIQISDLSIEINYQIDKNRTLIETTYPQKWILSYPLLLVQAIRLSQLEWENHDYCFEYFSAIRASSEIDLLFRKLSYDDNEVNFKKITGQFQRLIKWQTLNGQNKRNSASFSTKSVELGIPKEEQKMHLSIAYCDEMLRCNSYVNEIKVAETIRMGEIDKLFSDDFLEFDPKVLSPKKFVEGFQQEAAKNQSESNDLDIFSYLRLNNDKYETFNLKLREFLSQKARTMKGENKRASIHHFIIDRTQRKKGILKRLGEAFENTRDLLDFAEYFLVQVPEKLHQSGSIYGMKPEEEIFMVYIKPIKVLELIHGFTFEGNPEPTSAIHFLKLAFEAALKKFDGTLPHPIVEKILNLLPYFNAAGGGRSNEGKEIPAAFYVRIIFDQKQKLEFWLPEVSEKSDLILKETFIDIAGKFNASLLEILERYIHYSITNYGMTEQFSHVDIDLSFASDDSNVFWENKLKESRKNYGTHIFGRYLEDCGTQIIRSTFSLESYDRFIESRKLVNPYQIKLDEATDIQKKNRIIKSIEKEINQKVILGIDIGGTGIKMRFYKINSGERDPEQNDFILLKYDAEGPTNGYYYLTWDKNEYVIPTEQKEGKLYEDATDFANYILNSLKQQISEDSWKTHAQNLISIGVSWPGPIKQNTVASTSGILQKFVGFERNIMNNTRSKILTLTIGDSIKDVFKKEIDKEISVSLSNDGDVEAAGMAYGLINQIKFSNNNKKEQVDKISGRELVKYIIENQRVAIIKCGTGTAGAILQDGMFSGLNEFGKVILDLVADNRENLRKIDEKRENEVWPQGDINKFFSIKFIQEEAKKAGINADFAHQLNGRDIDLLFKKERSVIKRFDKNRIILFGVLELIDICKPKIKWDDLIQSNNTLIEGATLIYNHSDNYFFVDHDTGKASDTIDMITWKHLAKITSIQSLVLVNKRPISLISFLEKLGWYRISKINLCIEDNENKAIIEDLGFNMGRKLADILGLLHQIKQVKLLIIGGGPMKSKALGSGVDKGLEHSAPLYLHSRFFDKLEKLNLEKPNFSFKESKSTRKIFYYRQGSDFAILGAAMLGFDFFIKKHKIKELQMLAKEKGAIFNHITFLQINEAENFLRAVGPRLRITYDPNTKMISSIG